MKIKWSPLVGSASGTTADAVAASWKGIQYIRKHVIPHNPKSAAQTLVRESLARCVTLWRALSNSLKTWLNTYGVDYRMSGFNVFMKKSRALEQAGALIKPVPDNPYCAAPSTLVIETGAGVAGDIDVSWVDNSPTDFSGIIFLARLASSQTFEKELDTDSDAGSYTIAGLTAGGVYDVYAFFHNPTTLAYGTPDGTLSVTSKA